MHEFQSVRKSEPANSIGVLICTLFLSLFFYNSASGASDLTEIDKTSDPLIEHCDATVASGDLLDIFVCGDELFEIRYNALDGGGMNVGDGGRYTRVPRIDLQNWANTTPVRTTGPNATACNVCHTTETIGGAGDGAGPTAFNAIRDPQQTGQPGSFIQRNVPHLFGMAGPQLVAEEMTENLAADRQRAIELCTTSNNTRTVKLRTKNVDFGTVTATPPCNDENVQVQAIGIADDLIVRPFQWKGTTASIREFARDAFHNELGMDAVEITGDGVDGDFDGISDEISIADVTAMTIYLAAQPRPTTLLELDGLRRMLLRENGGAELVTRLALPELDNTQRQRIKRGGQKFNAIGCASCHRPVLTTGKTVFKEPSDNPNYRDTNDVFPAGQSALIPQISYDITKDVPDNQIALGTLVHHMGNFETNRKGEAQVRLYGDLKQHDMGPGLAENIDEAGNGRSMWMTKELWGLANTGPYLHDGRATTIEEAILAHGGEAARSATRFFDLSVAERTSMLEFLNNLVLFFPADE